MVHPQFLTSPPGSVAGVILAGGQARRLGGGDKGAITFGGRTILARLVEILAPQVDALAINANGDPSRFAPLGLPILADEVGAAGPLAGLLAGMEWAAASGHSWLLTAPNDTPFLPFDLVIRLAHGLRHGPAAIAASGGRGHPVVGLWPVEHASALRHFLVEQGRRKVGDWAEHCRAVAVEWPDQPCDPLFNLNTGDDRAEAESLCAVAGPRTAAIVLPGKDSCRELVEDFAVAAAGRGLRLGGLIQRGHHGAVMVDLATGATFSIMQNLGRDGGCAIDTQAVAAAAMVLRDAIERRCQLVVVNKLGPLEAEGGGLADEMMMAMAEDLPLLTTVSLERLDAWLRYCGGHCELLPPDPAALRRWADRIVTASAR